MTLFAQMRKPTQMKSIQTKRPGRPAKERVAVNLSLRKTANDKLRRMAYEQVKDKSAIVSDLIEEAQ